MRSLSIFFGVSILFLNACNLSEQKQENELSAGELFVEHIKSAHQDSLFLSKEQVHFDLKLVFGSKIRFDGRVYLDIHQGLVKMQDSSKTLIWDGKEAIVLPKDLNYEKARFDLLTWSYFFLAPYKLGDPGTHMELLGMKKLNGKNYEAGRLTFNAGVGDSPDDWYICYQDTESELLAAMAYIVSYSQSVEEAEKDPHCISYEAYSNVAGIPFPTVWNFWTWNEDGELKKLLGTAQISKIDFTKKESGFFKPDSPNNLP